MQETTEQQNNPILESGKLNELRQLLIGLDLHELGRLQKLIRDPHEFSEEIKEWLPHSIRKLIESGQINPEDLEPFIVDAMHNSIKKNPQRLADVLFPVMGPAIRKAVAEDMKKLIASVNTSLEAGLSPKSLKWRIQAMFSKRSFAEIVIANTYVYHVRQVFFIHRETGILLHQEKDKESAELEADMVSGMLTAIRDFVQDSFKGKSGGSLDEIQAGELKILIEQGPYAIVAAVVEGQPPASYRTILMETVEALHFNHAMDLERFEGHTEVFSHSAKFLRNCLIKERKEQKKSKVPWPLLFILFIILAAGTYFLYLRFEQKSRFWKFVTELEASPGYHLTEVDILGNKLFVKGLCDYQAPSARNLLAKYAIDSTKVIFRLEPFISLENEMVVIRAVKFLQPPSTVEMRFADEILYFSGTASQEWLERAVDQATKVYGVSKADISGMNVVRENKIPEIQQIVKTIQKNCFGFEMNIVSLDEQQQIRFDSLVQAVTQLDAYNRENGSNLMVYVKTYTSKSGNAAANLQVANRRVSEFIRLLQEAGLHNAQFETQVLFEGDYPPGVPLRSVCLEVFDKSSK
jgi:OOP family OmpA-OmpF porin